MDETSLAVFESKQIRRSYDEDTEIWYFSIVDVVETLTDSANATDYLKKIRKRDVELGSYIGTNCPQIEMMTTTGKKRKTLAGTVKDILRLIQYVEGSSPRATIRNPVFYCLIFSHASSSFLYNWFNLKRRELICQQYVQYVKLIMSKKLELI
jgi:hypothetical protein